jgi:hypothetical protein
MFRYKDPFVQNLAEQIAALILGEAIDRESVEQALEELALANLPQLADYWRKTGCRLGIPDSAFKNSHVYYFPDQPAARVFRTSGTSGADRGAACYSPLGLKLMDLSIIENARRHLIQELDRPVIIRFVPTVSQAPDMIMAYGMELIATTFGDKARSASVITGSGVDFERLRSILDQAVSDDQPVVLLGGSFAFVNICDALEKLGRSWRLPEGSRTLDGGGFKGRSRVVRAGELRSAITKTFGITAERAFNVFGMTELASQLYDTNGREIGPLDERPKNNLPFLQARVRDSYTLAYRDRGEGLVEIMDACIIDRPHLVLTGDLGLASEDGVAIIGRVERGQARGCSLSLESIKF